MVKNSTLFYFFDEFNLENELYETEELTDPGNQFRDELDEIFRGIEFSPRDIVLERIFNET